MPQLVIETRNTWMVRCANCSWHDFPKKGLPGATWSFNGNLEKPTFSPSMNYCLNPENSKHHNPEHPTVRCHFTSTNGVMEYHGDCSHELRGKHEMLPWDDAKIAYYKALKEEEGW